MRRSVLLAAVAGLVVLGAGLHLEAGDQDRERADLLKAFQQMRDEFRRKLPNPKITEREPGFPVSKSPYAGKKVKTMDSREVGDVVSKFKPKKVQAGGQTVTAKNIVKVWATVDDDTKVHLSNYKWKRKQSFYLWFETALPVKIALYQEHPDKPASKNKELVLPQKDYPASFDVVQPGKPYRLPIEMEMDDDNKDEHMIIAIMGVGTKVEPNLTPDEKDGRRYTAKSANDYRSDVDEFFRAALRKNLEWKTSNKRVNLRPGQDPGSRASSRSADDVAIIAAGQDQSGFIKIVLKKGG